MTSIVVIFYSLFLIISLVAGSVLLKEWDLPAVPSDIKHPLIFFNYTDNSKNYTKKVPRNIWIAVRDTKDSESLPKHLKEFLERNKNWNKNIVSNVMKDEFMNKTFANTSLLWAYHLINPLCGAAKADIWRYAVLYVYGGVYIDDDSDIVAPLDTVVKDDDELVISYEKNGFNGNRCYIPKFHLSDFHFFNNITNENLSKINKDFEYVILNWLIISSPKHPIILRTLINLVEIIRHEYLHENVLRSLHTEYGWAAIMCATGPSLFTASTREFVLNSDYNNKTAPYRMAYQDFKEYGGKFKAVARPVRQIPGHFMNVLHKHKVKLLSHFSPQKSLTESILRGWQGEAIQGQNGREIFVIDNLKRRGIPNFDTFMAMNFTMATVRVIADKKLHSIPLGDTMPSLMK